MLRTTIFAAAALIAMPVQAATVTFDFANTVDNTAGAVNTISVDGDVTGYSVTVSSTNNGPDRIRRRLTQVGSGLGVTNANDTNEVVDGNSGNEGLLFVFNRRVRIEEILFANVNANDNVRVFFDAAGGAVNYVRDSNPDEFIGTDDDAVQFASVLIDGAAVQAIQNNDNFVVTSVIVSEVPLPAAGVLFGSVLGLAGLYKRRKATGAVAA